MTHEPPAALTTNRENTFVVRHDLNMPRHERDGQWAATNPTAWTITETVPHIWLWPVAFDAPQTPSDTFSLDLR